MSDQRRIVPSDTPSACAACDVDRPRGLALICSMGHFTAFVRVRRASYSICTTSRPEDARFWPTVRMRRMQARHAAAALSPPRRRARRLPRDRDRPGDRAAALARTLAPRVGADRGAAVGALPRRAPGPAAARRLRGPAAPPVHARLARRRDRRLLPRGGRPAAAARRPRHRRRAGAAGGQHGPARAGAAGADAQPAAPPRRVRRQARGLAGGLPRRRRCRASTACSPTARRSCSAPRSASGCRRSATRRPAISSATRSPTSAATATARARGRSSRRRWPVEAQRAAARRLPADRRCRCCCCGPRRTRRIRSTAPREALDLLPDAQLRTLPGPGS